MSRKRIYAEDTRVSIHKSKEQIEELVVGKYGADAFGTFTDGGKINCFFRLRDRNIRFTMSEPGKPLNPSAIDEAFAIIEKED